MTTIYTTSTEVLHYRDKYDDVYELWKKSREQEELSLDIFLSSPSISYRAYCWQKSDETCQAVHAYNYEFPNGFATQEQKDKLFVLLTKYKLAQAEAHRVENLHIAQHIAKRKLREESRAIEQNMKLGL